MWRIVGIIEIAVLLFGAQGGQACEGGIPYDPPGIVRGLTEDQIISMLPEVVVEGVIEGDPVPAGPLFPPIEVGDGVQVNSVETVAVRMRVERVWKGTVSGSTISVRLDASGTDCSRDPPFGKRIRIGGMALSDTEMFYENFDLPADQWNVTEALKDYGNSTDALQVLAQTGGRAEKLAFGEHLFRNREWHRAQAVYQALLDVDPHDLDALLALVVIRTELDETVDPEKMLADVRRLVPKTREWQARIAYANFRATGRFEPGWLDWANLDEEPWARCEPGNADLRGAVFDGAKIPDRCDFSKAQLQGASFRGVDLRNILLWDPDGGYTHVKGAKYDCATRFHPAFDPVAAKMINVEGTCPGD